MSDADEHADDEPENRGMYEKFSVTRLTPSSRGIDHSGCVYYVLDLTHDPAAAGAMEAYAEAVRDSHPRLAEDISRTLADLGARRALDARVAEELGRLTPRVREVEE